MNGKIFYQFFDWWLKGLHLLLPDGIRKQLQKNHPELIVKVDKLQYEVQYFPENSDVPTKNWMLNLKSEMTNPADIDDINQEISPTTKVKIVLPFQQLLRKTVTLPAAAKSNLESILRFELDKYTPFSQEQVYFSWLITDIDSKKNKIKIDLFIILKEVLDKILTDLKVIQSEIDNVTVEGVADSLQMNLLPRQHYQSKLTYPTLIYPSLVGIVFLMMLYLPLWRHDSILSNLEGEVATLSTQANEVQSLLDNRNSALARIQFLEEKQQKTLPTITVLQELTTLLPDDTWLQRLSITDNQIQFNGESGAASVIIQKLEDSSLFTNVRFQSPVVKNAGTGKDRYQVIAELVLREST